MSTTVRSAIRCRSIAEQDLVAVVDLLARGFPGRSAKYWMRGLRRHAARPVPADCPRYGYVLDNGGTLVGAILVLCTEARAGASSITRCNLSSWYVEPAFRGQASLLIAHALKNKHATYLNVTPARHTWPVVEAQGFMPYCIGRFFALPALGGSVGDVEIRQVTVEVADKGDLPADEFKLLVEHASYGCLSLVCAASDGGHPFVFVPFRIRRGRITLPCMHLLYCREVADFVRFAGPLGRRLLRCGSPLVAIDANGPVPGLVGIYQNGSARKYFKGPNRPRLGDFAYTELALLGP